MKNVKKLLALALIAGTFILSPTLARAEEMASEEAATTETVTKTEETVKSDDLNAYAEEVATDLGGESPLSLQDMAKAQDTITRLGYLLEIERKLSEIDTVRKTREGVPFGGQLSPPSLPTYGGAEMLPTGGMMGLPSGGMAGGPEGIAVSRIFGTNGAYSAVIVYGQDKSMIARVGDVLPNGAKVKSVTMSGVKTYDKYGEYNLPFASAGQNTESDSTYGDGLGYKSETQTIQK